MTSRAFFHIAPLRGGGYHVRRDGETIGIARSWTDVIGMIVVFGDARHVQELLERHP